MLQLNQRVPSTAPGARAWVPSVRARKRSVLARSERDPREGNVDGQFFVDHTCIDCDTCRWMAPDSFARVGSQSAVFKQPIDRSGRIAAIQATLSCPTYAPVHVYKFFSCRRCRCDHPKRMFCPAACTSLVSLPSPPRFFTKQKQMHPADDEWYHRMRYTCAHLRCCKPGQWSACQMQLRIQILDPHAPQRRRRAARGAGRHAHPCAGVSRGVPLRLPF